MNARRRAAHHSQLSTLFLCVTILGLLLILAEPFMVAENIATDRFGVGFHVIAVFMLGVLAITMYLASQAKTYRICLLLFLALSILYLFVFTVRSSSFAILLSIGILCIVLYEPYPMSLVFCLSFVTCLCVAFPLSLGHADYDLSTALVAGVTSFIIGSVFSFVGCMLGRTRNELVTQSHVNTRLAENVVKLTEANVSSLSFAATVEDDSRTSERRRLAREIHDLVGYTLTTNITLMEAVKLMATTEPAKIPEYVETIRKNSEDALAQIRAVLRDLHSKEDDLDLISLMTKLKNVYSFSTGVQVNYEYGNVNFRRLERFRDVLYHFVQEALINAFRHGKAASATVFYWQIDHQVEITVEDDGIGASSLEEDIGIQGMRERAQRVNGTVTIPPVKIGFKIKLSLPLQPERSSV